MQMQRPIAGIGEVIREEATSLIKEGKKTVKESVEDIGDTVLWVLTFGLIEIGRGKPYQEQAMMGKSSEVRQTGKLESIDSLAIRDRQETNEQIKRYRAMIAEEQEISTESDQKLIDWRKITDAEMKKGQTQAEAAPPAADLSDLGSTRSNPSLFARSNKEQIKKGGM